mgnify:CR=1 FL=1
MDNVNHPKHYEDGPFECIELTRLLSFNWGNVVKYCYRWQSKKRHRRLEEGALVRERRGNTRHTALC